MKKDTDDKERSLGETTSAGDAVSSQIDNERSSRLAQQMAFILEADREKNIGRQTYISDGTRKENDAEHAWHLALMAALLAEHSTKPVDTAKLMTMVLIHDIVEIDAGDTYAFDPEGARTKEDREQAAADRIFGMLPKDQGAWLRGLWEEFEHEDTPEARFARALDRLQPLMLNIATDGKSWEEHGIRRSQVMKRNEKTPEAFPALWEYLQGGINRCVEEGKLKDDQ